MEKREVRIRRHPKNSEYLPDEVVAESKVNLASIYDSSGQPLSGLSREEEKEYLPQFINTYPESRDFNKKRNEFWAEKVEKIPPGGGLLLDISKDVDGEPINVKDYITYRWAQKHKMVADNKQDAETSPMKWFYIYDPQEELDKKSNSVEDMGLAWQEFLQMKGDRDKLSLVARVFCNVRPQKLNDKRLKIEVREAMEDDPKGFVKVARDKDLERESMILEMVEHNVIRKIGNQFMYMDQVIGDSMEEAIAYIKNERNSGEVSTMRAKLKEAKN